MYTFLNGSFSNPLILAPLNGTVSIYLNKNISFNANSSFELYVVVYPQGYSDNITVCRITANIIPSAIRNLLILTHPDVFVFTIPELLAPGSIIADVSTWVLTKYPQSVIPLVYILLNSTNFAVNISINPRNGLLFSIGEFTYNASANISLMYLSIGDYTSKVLVTIKLIISMKAFVADLAVTCATAKPCFDAELFQQGICLPGIFSCPVSQMAVCTCSEVQYKGTVWRTTACNSIAINPCPGTIRQYRSRFCNAYGVFESENTTMCFSPVLVQMLLQSSHGVNYTFAARLSSLVSYLENNTIGPRDCCIINCFISLLTPGDVTGQFPQPEIT